MLSYAGRLQLVAYVLASMQVYWASVFILPKTMVKNIDRLLKGFKWCQGISRRRAKVARKLVYRPKNEGGLGIKNLYMPNADSNAKLCDMISNGEWKWPEIWINNYP
ncbi:hypothetical protein Tco_0673759 [Tanacetum coccineum]